MATVQALGEIALRVNDLDSMQDFYANVVGLELMKRFPQSAFFRIADGYGGHTAILALFARGTKVGAEQTTMDHLAFTIRREDHEPEKMRLEGLGLDVETHYHEWVEWRSLYIHDPEGNEVEFVCFDPEERPS